MVSTVVELRRMDSPDVRRMAKLFLDKAHAGDSSDHDAVLTLIECFREMKPNPEQCIEACNVKCLGVDLEIIEQCQRMALEGARHLRTVDKQRVQ